MLRRAALVLFLAQGGHGSHPSVKRTVGWLGPYHPSSGQTWSAPGVKNGTTVWEAFDFGTVCMENAVSDGGCVPTPRPLPRPLSPALRRSQQLPCAGLLLGGLLFL